MRKRATLYALLLGASLLGSTFNGLAEDVSAFPKGALYAVTGVAHHDHLNMRMYPQPSAWVLLRVPPQAKGVMSTGHMEIVSSQRWLLVHYAGVTGWVNTRFLRSQPPLSPRLKNSFFGNVVLQPLRDGRNMRVLGNMGYIDHELRKWEVPAGSTTDGASIPRPLWSIMGSPFTGKYLRASILHDRFVATKFRSWTDTHEMFFNAMLADGVDRAQATLMWAAVYRFGPRWTKNEATCWNGCIGDPAMWVDVRIDPEFVNADLEELKQLIADDPTIDREQLIAFIREQVNQGRAATISGRVIDFTHIPLAANGKYDVASYDEVLKHAKTIKTEAPLEWPDLGKSNRAPSRYPADVFPTK